MTKLIVVTQTVNTSFSPNGSGNGRGGGGGGGLDPAGCLLALLLFAVVGVGFVWGRDLFLGQHPVIGYLMMLAAYFVPYTWGTEMCQGAVEGDSFILVVFAVSFPLHPFLALSIFDFSCRVYHLFQ